MTILYIIETFIEFILMCVALIFLFVARMPGEGLVITKRFIKRKKYIGFAIVCIFLTMFCNYGYLVFRYFYPPSPYEFIEPLRNFHPNQIDVVK